MNQLANRYSWVRNANQMSLVRPGMSRQRHSGHSGLGGFGGLSNRSLQNYPIFDDICGCELFNGQHVCGSCASRLYQPDLYSCGCQFCDFFDDDDYAAYGGYGFRGGINGAYGYDPRA